MAVDKSITAVVIIAAVTKAMAGAFLFVAGHHIGSSAPRATLSTQSVQLTGKKKEKETKRIRAIINRMEVGA